LPLALFYRRPLTEAWRREGQIDHRQIDHCFARAGDIPRTPGQVMSVALGRVAPRA